MQFIFIVSSFYDFHHFLGFPNRAVVDAYLLPEVNQSRDKFSWMEPDLDALRDYLEEKIGKFCRLCLKLQRIK